MQTRLHCLGFQGVALVAKHSPAAMHRDSATYGAEHEREAGARSPPSPVVQERSASEMGMVSRSNTAGLGDSTSDDEPAYADSELPELLCTFEDEGSLGILFHADGEFGAVTSGGIGENSAAEKMEGLAVGMVLVTVQGASVAGLGFEFGGGHGARWRSTDLGESPPLQFSYREVGHVDVENPRSRG